MTADQLFAAMPNELAVEIIEFAASADKPLYKAVIEAVAQSRKVRAVFLERHPRSERHNLINASLARPALRPAADNLIRTWLLKKQSALLADFLDGLTIRHENGVVEDLPASVDDAVLHNAIERLLNKYPRPAVAIYLHAFNSMNDVGWSNLDALLKNDSRLSLNKDT
jgi:hypothetical protein